MTIVSLQSVTQTLRLEHAIIALAPTAKYYPSQLGLFLVWGSVATHHVTIPYIDIEESSHMHGTTLRCKISTKSHSK